MDYDVAITDRLASTRANHIAYQEHRRFPEDAFDDDTIAFWWGVMPGETAYPWIFPNDGTVARVGLTMPIGMELDDVENPRAYDLLREDDDRIPTGETYVRRLLEREFGDEYDVETDFPRVEDRGKDGGTETYPISSTRPVDSPTGAGIAIAGGAMGTTSAFHEGGYHVAIRSGKIAGSLAADRALDRYNDAWKDAIGGELRRNVAFADLVADYGPDDWDRVFRTVADAMGDGGTGSIASQVKGGVGGARLVARYKRAKFGLRKGRYVQLRESEYVV
ncbi:hypothetical protein BRD17_05125 [Halobacteriales archaeon SW_7_68_16]|nr:MAG: hypothetical protein BRD17_05125 [Halobacteriales archaeon SW_7_68_16]